MVSIGDLVKFGSKQQSFEIQYLTDYIALIDRHGVSRVADYVTTAGVTSSGSARVG